MSCRAYPLPRPRLARLPLLAVLVGFLAHIDPVAADPPLAWRFERDAAGRLSDIVDPSGARTRVVYHLDSSTGSESIIRHNPDGSRTSFELDRQGRRVRMDDAGGSAHYSYDAQGRLEEVRRDGLPTVRYTFDGDNRLRSQTVGDMSVRYAYDLVGNVEALETPAGRISYQYASAQERIERRLPNQVRTVWEFQADGNLTSITHAGPDDRILSRYAYSYKPEGLVAAVNDQTAGGERSLRFEYDRAAHLTRIEDSRFGAGSFTYDHLGNLTQTVTPNGRTDSSFDWAGRLTHHAARESTFDGAGNITSYANATGPLGFSYGPLSTLASLRTGASVVEYTYDGDAHLIARSAGGHLTRFVPDPLSSDWRPLAAVHEDGRQDLFIWEGAAPLARVTGADARFFLHDSLASVRMVTDDRGRVLESHDYSPFGASLSRVGNQAMANDLHPGFGGMFREPAANLYVVGRQVYDPNLGRSLQSRDATLDHALQLAAVARPNRRDVEGTPGFPLRLSRPAPPDARTIEAALASMEAPLPAGQTRAIASAVLDHHGWMSQQHLQRALARLSLPGEQHAAVESALIPFTLRTARYPAQTAPSSRQTLAGLGGDAPARSLDDPAAAAEGVFVAARQAGVSHSTAWRLTQGVWDDLDRNRGVPQVIPALQSAARDAGLTDEKQQRLAASIERVLRRPLLSSQRAQLLTDRAGGQAAFAGRDMDAIRRRLSAGPDVIDLARLRSTIARASHIDLRRRARSIREIESDFHRRSLEPRAIGSAVLRSSRLAQLDRQETEALMRAAAERLRFQRIDVARVQEHTRQWADKMQIPAETVRRIVGNLEGRETASSTASGQGIIGDGLVKVTPGVNSLWHGDLLDRARRLAPTAEVYVVTPKSVSDPSDPSKIAMTRIDRYPSNLLENMAMMFGRPPSGERVPLAQIPKNAVVVVDMELGWWPGRNGKWTAQTSWAGDVLASVEKQFRAVHQGPVIDICHSAGTDAALQSLDHGAHADKMILLSVRASRDPVVARIQRHGMEGRVLIQEAFNDLPRNLMQPVSTSGFYKSYSDPRFMGTVYDLVKIGPTPGTFAPLVQSARAHGIGFDAGEHLMRINDGELVRARMDDVNLAFVGRGLRSSGPKSSELRAGSSWRETTWQGQMASHPQWLLDFTYAKQWYAQRAERARSSSEGELVARAFDAIGGYIPGKPKSIGQEQAGVLWSFVPPVAMVRSVAGVPINLAEHNPIGVVWDALSIASRGMKALVPKLAQRTHPDAAGQHVFDYLTDAPTRASVDRFSSFQQAVGRLLNFHKAERVYHAFGGDGPAPHTSADLAPGAGGTVSWRSAGVDPLRPETANASDTRRRLFRPRDMNPILGGGPPRPPGGASAALDPNRVGGVDLSGAAALFQDLHEIKGIDVDPDSGRWVLIGEGGANTNLPALRIDDLVTVFRSVYDEGEAPRVTIDPVEANPEGPVMVVKHGHATERTYVGWVLLESDRIMKNYSTGCDNLTREPYTSTVPGYSDVLTASLLRSPPSSAAAVWERFWIRPAAAHHRVSANQSLSLFDVPLLVDTEPMLMKGGRLVSAARGTSSERAKTFTAWFTDNYTAISAEAVLQPPSGCGSEHPVHIYDELRRIALMTAVAESLRDRGIAMPAWMRDYSVQSCALEESTPAIRSRTWVMRSADAQEPRHESPHVECFAADVEPPAIDATAQRGSGELHVLRVYGGVNLAAADSARHVGSLEPREEALAARVVEAANRLPLLSTVSLSDGDKQIEAITLPGATTLGVGACRLQEADLSISPESSMPLRLTRYYSSFFPTVSDTLGRAWTLDLPRLEKKRLPVRRSNDKVEYRLVYHLTSPLSTYDVTFATRRKVPEVGVEMMVPETESGILGLGAAADPRLHGKSHVVVFRDGRRWHFDDAGALIAAVSSESWQSYRRDEHERLVALESWSGGRKLGEIVLSYDEVGRLIAAAGNGESTSYGYDAQGRLSSVRSPSHSLQYLYRDALVVATVVDGVVARQFEYGRFGELRREVRADGSQIEYHVTSADNGTQVVSLEDGQEIELAQYDARSRPLRRRFDDGTELSWTRNEQGDAELSQGRLGETPVRVRYSAGDRSEDWQTEQGRYRVEYDEAGRLASLSDHAGDELMRQRWASDGRLLSQQREGVVFSPRYNDDGSETGLLIALPEEGPTAKRWIELQFDAKGRVAKVTDQYGSDLKLGYDPSGQVGSVDLGKEAIQIERDASNRVTRIGTSWGREQLFEYDPAGGALRKTIVSNAGAKSTVELDDGRPTKASDFVGNELQFTYREGTQTLVRVSQQLGDTKSVYDFDDDGRPAMVNVADVQQTRLRWSEDGFLAGVEQEPGL